MCTKRMYPSRAFSSFDTIAESDSARSDYDKSYAAPVKANPYRKRPTKFTYDKNEFDKFIYPSERRFLYGSFDQKDIFGERKNINHSPYISAQMDLDNKLIIAWACFMVILMFREIKEYEKYKILRVNHLNSNMGWIDEDNLI
eukprot:CAMPEP_0196995796 /NCGR_PEP_ID=MMETSP1380-20130617/1837_1 /TAXON_ID=5936 /ORGANISM="Euplotes crassus, Strain CT5" /LENGTH=142 /DNA_ID=CAMNT_0042411579 /DNA_START=37 /DNA_END=465 /DNA_ORIENTATION=-